MGTVTKKSKEKKRNEVEKIREYASKYSQLAIVGNSNIPNTILKKIREDFSDGAKILFIRKKMAKAMYNMPEMPRDPFFLMFGDESAIERAMGYQYQDFLSAGDVCPVRAIIEKQAVRDKEMIELLPVLMKDNQMQLMNDQVVCEANEIVDEDKAKILRFFGQRLKKRNFDILTITTTANLLKNE